MNLWFLVILAVVIAAYIGVTILEKKKKESQAGSVPAGSAGTQNAKLSDMKIMTERAESLSAKPAESWRPTNPKDDAMSFLRYFTKAVFYFGILCGWGIKWIFGVFKEFWRWFVAKKDDKKKLQVRR